MTSEINYWLYCLSPNFIDAYKREKTLIAFEKKEKVAVNDVIHLFCRNGRDSSFRFVLRVASPVRENNEKILIFDDEYFNRYIVDVIVEFEINKICSGDFVKSIVENKTYDNDLKAFSGKYLKRMNVLIPFGDFGWDLLVFLSDRFYEKEIKRVFSFDHEDTEEDRFCRVEKVMKTLRRKPMTIDDIDDYFTRSARQEKVKNDIEEKKKVTPREGSLRSAALPLVYKDYTFSSGSATERSEPPGDEDPDSRLSKLKPGECVIIKSAPDNYKCESDDDYIFIGSDKEEELEPEPEEDLDTEVENERGFIPILIIPCSEFEIPLSDKSKYFREHYMRCDTCEITNNNNRELSSILHKEETTVLVKNITTEDNELVDDSLEHYFSLKKLDPTKKDKYPLVRVILINNKHKIYHGCVIVLWNE